jgi:hypothetical protein
MKILLSGLNRVGSVHVDGVQKTISKTAIVASEVSHVTENEVATSNPSYKCTITMKNGALIKLDDSYETVIAAIGASFGADNIGGEK